MEYLFFGYLLLQSAFFSGSETALFSIGKVALTRLRQSDGRGERAVARLLQYPRNLLVTVLLGNELSNIALAITSASIISGLLPDSLGVAQKALISTGLVLPILLVVGEVTPKTIAAHRPELVARIVAPPLRVFAVLTTPVRLALRWLTDALVRRLGGHPEVGGDRIDEREFRTLVDVGTAEGVVQDNERALIHNVLDFDNLTVADVMIPWDQVFTLTESTPIEAAIEAVAAQKHSRIPIYRDNPREVVGVLFAKNLTAIRWGVKPAQGLRRLCRKPIFTLPKRSADDLLDECRARRVHMAVVVDEFGRAIGLVTLQDLLEELFGPIHEHRREGATEKPGASHA